MIGLWIILAIAVLVYYIVSQPQKDTREPFIPMGIYKKNQDLEYYEALTGTPIDEQTKIKSNNILL